MFVVLIVAILFAFRFYINKNKLLATDNDISDNLNIGEKHTTDSLNPQVLLLEQLPIKVNKVKMDSKELKQNTKLALPVTAYPVINEVVQAFYPVIQDRDKLKVIFTPTMMEELKKGTAKLMDTKDGVGFRAMAVATEGRQKIMEHAKLVQEINPALILNASFQLASVIVAQQHMQHINQSLKQIKRQLEKLRDFHMKEYLFHAKGNIEYFELRVIPHFQAYGTFDFNMRIQAENRFNKTIDILPNILNKQQSLLGDIENVKTSVYFGKIFAEEEKEVKELKQILNDYSECQEIIDLYFKWVREMYIPFLITCGYSDIEIQAIEQRVKEFEVRNLNNYKGLHTKIKQWTDKFKVKLFRINEKKYLETSISAVKAALPKPISTFETKSIINNTNQPLEMIIEYLNNGEMNTYLVGSPSPEKTLS